MLFAARQDTDNAAAQEDAEKDKVDYEFRSVQFEVLEWTLFHEDQIFIRNKTIFMIINQSLLGGTARSAFGRHRMVRSSSCNREQRRSADQFLSLTLH